MVQILLEKTKLMPGTGDGAVGVYGSCAGSDRYLSAVSDFAGAGAAVLCPDSEICFGRA